MLKREPSCELEKELFKNVFEKTPDYIKNSDLLNFDNFDLVLTYLNYLLSSK